MSQRAVFYQTIALLESLDAIDDDTPSSEQERLHSDLLRRVPELTFAEVFELARYIYRYGGSRAKGELREILRIDLFFASPPDLFRLAGKENPWELELLILKDGIKRRHDQLSNQCAVAIAERFRSRRARSSFLRWFVPRIEREDIKKVFALRDSFVKSQSNPDYAYNENVAFHGAIELAILRSSPGDMLSILKEIESGRIEKATLPWSFGVLCSVYHPPLSVLVSRIF